MSTAKPVKKEIENAYVLDLGTVTTSDGRLVHAALVKSSSQVEQPTFGATAMQPPLPYDDLLRLFERNTWHKRCLRVKAAMVAYLGVSVVALPDKDGVTPPDVDPLTDPAAAPLRRFIRRANDRLESLPELLYRTELDRALFGSGYWEPVLSTDRKAVAELYHIPTFSIRPTTPKDAAGRKRVEYQQAYPGSSTTARFVDLDATDSSDAGRIVALMEYNPSSRYFGDVTYSGAIPTMLLDDQALMYNLSFFANRGLPAVILEIRGGDVTPEVRTQIQNFLVSEFKGNEQVHRAMVLPTGDKEIEIHVHQIEPTVREGSFRQVRGDCRDEVVAAHEVPPVLAGVPQQGRLGSGGEKDALKAFMQLVVRPLQERVELAFNTRIAPLLSPGFGIQLGALSLDDPASVANLITALGQAGVDTAPLVATLDLPGVAKSSRRRPTLSKAGAAGAALATLRAAVGEIQQAAETAVAGGVA